MVTRSLVPHSGQMNEVLVGCIGCVVSSSSCLGLCLSESGGEAMRSAGFASRSLAILQMALSPMLDASRYRCTPEGSNCICSASSTFVILRCLSRYSTFFLMVMSLKFFTNIVICLI